MAREQVCQLRDSRSWAELDRQFAVRGVDRLNVTIRRGSMASMAFCTALGDAHEEPVTVW